MAAVPKAVSLAYVFAIRALANELRCTGEECVKGVESDASNLLQAHLAGPVDSRRPGNGGKIKGAGFQPNILFLLVDDLGFADVDVCPPDVEFKYCMQRPMSPERAKYLKTPRLKKMAEEGLIFSNFYSPRPICTPSRAGLLTGRDVTRYRLTSPLLRVLPNSAVRGGVPQEEITTAEYLKEQGYTTGYGGKWHMGLGTDDDPFHYTPWKQGYDEVSFFIEGSNSEPCKRGAQQYANDRNIYSGCTFSHVMNSSGVVLEQPIRWENITARHTLDTLNFIKRHANDPNPWYFWHAYTSTHIPWVPSRFWITDPDSKPWTDFVHDIDWSVGVFLDTLKKLHIDQKTLVILASDNGAYLESASTWCPQNCKRLTPKAQIDGLSSHYGCEICDKNMVSLSEPLKGGKASTYDGGVRTPGIWWWPGSIPAGGITSAVAGHLDFLPTAVALAGGKLKEGVAYDGKDLSAVILNKPDPAAPPVGEFFYFCSGMIMAVRKDAHKIVWAAQKFLGEDLEPTPPNHCAGTGACCSGIATRMCVCQLSTYYDPPMVIDLTENVFEDPELALDPKSPGTKEIVKVAEGIRLAKARSIADDNGVPWEEDSTAEDLMTKVSQEPSLMLVDYCMTSDNITFDPSSVAEEKDIGFAKKTAVKRKYKAMGSSLYGLSEVLCDQDPKGNITISCPLIPPKCQVEEFKPYDGCDMNTNWTDTAQACAQRRPCGVQEGYAGPFEYVNPTGSGFEPCGAFRQPTITSHFPEELLQSVCDWQDEYKKLAPSQQLCSPRHCLKDHAEVAKNEKVCFKIAQGISTTPTGYLWNAPYPEDQEDPMNWDGALPRCAKSAAHWYGYGADQQGDYPMATHDEGRGLD